VNEVATGRRGQERKHPYEARKPQARGRTEGNRPVRHNFVVELKDLIVVPNIADRLRVPAKIDKVLGPHKDAWCEFHQAFGHHITNCLALGHQLDELVKSGFLKDYLAGSSAAAALVVPEEDQAYEMPIHGEVHTISGGFSGGGCTASQCKRYVRSVISRHLDALAWSASDKPDIDLDFLCHHLTIDSKVRLVWQRRRKFNEERRLVVQQETKKLLSAGHIREIQYLGWLANVVLVKKANGKWRMCVDFTDLNRRAPKIRISCAASTRWWTAPRAAKC